MGAILEHRWGKRPSRVAISNDHLKVDSSGGIPSNEEETIRALRERTQKHPKDVEAWIQLGNLKFDLNQPREAISAYENALQLKPNDPDVLTDLGVMYRRIGQPEKAVALFREAQRKDSGHFQSLYNLGVVLLHDLNDVSGAVQAWENYLRVIPQGPQSDHIRRVLQRLKDREDRRNESP
jgi:cytochrome c-type biogenesis protein CcmH/NrfG